MSNSIEYAKLYTNALAEIFKNDSKTAVLENNSLVQMVKNAEADEVKIPKMEMDALADYSRGSGYTAGNLSLAFETRKLTQDRGRKFNLDKVDDLESMHIIHANFLAQFERNHVIPEIDSYRFAKLAQGAGFKVSGALTTATAVKTAINNAKVAMDEAEVPAENRILFVTPTILNLLEDTISRMVMDEATKINREVTFYDGMQVIAVPQTRFYSGFQKLDEGGYETEGSAINFMIVLKDAVIPVVKLNDIRIFDPNVNQSADAYQYDYRVYHDMFIWPNRANGIYCHTNSEETETVDTPKITVTGDKTATVKFTVTCPTTGATLYYTTDGTTPTSSSSQYSSEVTLSGTGSKTIKVIGIKTGMLNSKVASKTATIA